MSISHVSLLCGLLASISHVDPSDWPHSSKEYRRPLIGKLLSREPLSRWPLARASLSRRPPPSASLTLATCASLSHASPTSTSLTSAAHVTLSHVGFPSQRPAHHRRPPCRRSTPQQHLESDHLTNTSSQHISWSCS